MQLRPLYAQDRTRLLEEIKREVVAEVDNDASANPGSTYSITFNLASGSTINESGSLQLSAPNTTVDGTVSGSPGIVIRTPNTALSFYVTASYDVFHDLVTQDIGLAGSGANHDTIDTCYLGTDVTGKSGSGLLHNGVQMGYGAHDNAVKNSVIAGNVGDSSTGALSGVFIVSGSNSNSVVSNRIGITISGTALANDIGVGIVSFGTAGTSNNKVGGAHERRQSM